jgi:hypothetical protein
VILSAVVPTLIATTFFEPRIEGEIEAEEVEAADEIDAGPLRRPRVRTAAEGAELGTVLAVDDVRRTQQMAGGRPSEERR